jgi:phosphorylcholine metabolism protein LicD
MDKNLAFNNLLSITMILEELGIEYFLAYGTLLGAVREKDFIEHDLDIDIYITEPSFKMDFFKKAIEHGFEIKNIFGMLKYGGEISVKRDKIKIDIFFLYFDEKKQQYWNAIWLNGCVNGPTDMIKHVYPAEIFNYIRGANIQGRYFIAPIKQEEYLELVYGKDWRTPKKEFDWRTDHQCKEK